MRSTTVLVLLVTAAWGCHSAPPPAPDAHPATTTQSAIAASSQQAPIAAQPASTLAQSASSDQAKTNADLLKKGYRPLQKNGQTVYCRREMLTGSRFTTQVCLTEEQIVQLEAQAKEDLQLSTRQSCNNPAASCTGN